MKNTSFWQQAEIDGVTDTDGTKLFVKEKMDPWVDQRGYPLVNITLTGPGTARAEQTQFLSPQNQVPPPSPFLWVLNISSDGDMNESSVRVNMFEYAVWLSVILK